MILAILQARMSSSRLHGKVLKPILGEPMLWRQIERLLRSQMIDRLIVATSSDVSDDPIEELCKAKGIYCFRGNLEDVLDRFYHAARPFDPSHIIRLTGDCPVADPALIDQMVDFHLFGDFDYTSNVIEPSYPDGLDVEIFKFTCLEKAYREATLPSQREHVTPFIYQQPALFNLGSYKNETDFSHLRWTVDESSDFELITFIYEQLYSNNPMFDTSDILNLLDRFPEKKTMNTCFQRNEGYEKSLLQDLQTKQR